VSVDFLCTSRHTARSVSPPPVESSQEILHPSRNIEVAPLSEGGLMLVNLETGGCWQLNRGGGEVWELFKDGSYVELVAEKMAQRYGLSQTVVLPDVQGVVQDLTAKGLLMPATST